MRAVWRGTAGAVNPRLAQEAAAVADSASSARSGLGEEQPLDFGDWASPRRRRPVARRRAR
jgi:hypothetical protein